MHPKKPIEVGDPVQWICAGSYQFPKPKVVVRIIDDPIHGSYVFVAGSHTGIRLEEVFLWDRRPAKEA